MSCTWASYSKNRPLTVNPLYVLNARVAIRERGGWRRVCKTLKKPEHCSTGGAKIETVIKPFSPVRSQKYVLDLEWVYSLVSAFVTAYKIQHSSLKTLVAEAVASLSDFARTVGRVLWSLGVLASSWSVFAGLAASTTSG